MKRLAHFLRSVLPVDPAQLLFLVGVVCLVISSRLRWWPPGLQLTGSVPNTAFQFLLVRIGSSLLAFVLVFASLAGYFVCIWPGRHPIRRVLVTVFAPALAAMALLIARMMYLTAPGSSVLEPSYNVLTRELLRMRSIPWKSLPGLHLCALGLLLIAIFLSRMAFGIASLPLSLPEDDSLNEEQRSSWHHLAWLLWFLVGPLFATDTLSLSFVLLTRIHGPWLKPSALILQLGLASIITLLIMGKDARQTLRQTIRWPGQRYLFLAAFLPIALAVLLSLGQYAFDRADWSLGQFDADSRPDFRSYFSTPDNWLLLLFFAAFFEEIIFRGALQPKFIQRYGLHRGIFLIGAVWAAFHFVSDFSFSGASDLDVLAKLASRLFLCITLSFVFGWLALRSGSVFPSTIAHMLYNIFALSNFGFLFSGGETLRVALWAILAFVLFRYWPPTLQDAPVLPPAIAENLADPA